MFILNNLKTYDKPSHRSKVFIPVHRAAKSIKSDLKATIDNNTMFNNLVRM